MSDAVAPEGGSGIPGDPVADDGPAKDGEQSEKPASRVTPRPPGLADEVAKNPETMPRRFGKYTLLRKLAVGGMAELYLALQKSVAGFEKLIVVKRVLPRLAQDQTFIEMLLQEAKIAATLNHPNVAQTYDVGFAEGDYYIAMEHVHGEDLRQIVRQMKKKRTRVFPLENTIAIVLGCCKGLAYAHDKRDFDGEPLEIVHRDVSPQNILVTFTGDVKLVDFGIAKAAGQGEEEGGKLKGKVPYMSPEQAQAHPLDRRSDIFSLGVMFFELTTGKRLFRGKGEHETLKKIVEGNYPTPRSINPALDERLEAIIMKCLVQDVDGRYQHAAELQADLEAFIREERMVVSTLSLGEWMRDLFDDKLAQQKKLLQEGRQLAEVLAVEEPSLSSLERSSITNLSSLSSVSGITTIPPDQLPHPSHPTGAVPAIMAEPTPSKAPWLILLALLGVGAAAAMFFLTRAEPAPVPVVRGSISITSAPEGAAIWIDGARRAERTPAEIGDLALPSDYSVRLTLADHEPHEANVELSEAVTGVSMHAALVPIERFGIVDVRTQPAGAQIFVDGHDTGLTTPSRVPDLAAGEEHTVVLSLERYVTQSLSVTLTPGEVLTRTVPLEREPLAEDEALLVLVTTPANAEVSFDRQTIEGTSPFEIRTRPGRHRLSVSGTGYVTQRSNVRLGRAEVDETTVELAPTRRRRGDASMVDMSESEMEAQPAGPGRLTVSATPWCNISIDGRAVGQTPVVNYTVDSGSHRITCVNPDLSLRRSITVSVAAGQTVRRRINLQ